MCSVVGFAFILLSFYSKKLIFLKYADAIGGIIIAILTIRIGFKLLIENISLSIGESDLDNKKINDILFVCLKEKNIFSVGNIIILKYGLYDFLTLELSINKELNLDYIYNIESNIKKEIKKKYNRIHYISINIKPI